MKSEELQPLADTIDEMIEAALEELKASKDNSDYPIAAASASRLYDLFLLRLQILHMGDAE